MDGLEECKDDEGVEHLAALTAGYMSWSDQETRSSWLIGAMLHVDSYHSQRCVLVSVKSPFCHLKNQP